MKRLLLILPVAATLSGCIAYQPSPSVGQYGYTYDYQVPIGDAAAPPIYSTIREPQRTAVITAPAVSPTVVVADAPPSPPITPPIYSEIPDLTPPEDRVIEKRTTVFVPQQQPRIINEGAGAQPAAGAVQQQPAVVGGGYPSTVYSGGGYPFFPITPTNIVTNPPSTNPPSTNGLSGITNQIGITNQVGVTNQVNVTNAFGIARGTNITEAAGAQPTNNVPQQLEAAPRLPEQPVLQPGEDDPVSAPSPDTVVPTQPNLPPQQQPPAVPNPAPVKSTFSPAAVPAGQLKPAPPVPQQQPPAVQPQ